jgi:glycosyltransferase involved in cell wall biosynthesis
MRVLLTHELFAPDFAGGGEYIVLEVARGLKRRGVEVTVLTTGDPLIREYEGIPTVRLPIHRHRFNLAVRKTAEMARKADIIQTFSYHAGLPALLAGKLTGKPAVYFTLALYQDLWKQMRSPFVGGLFSAWERFLITRNFARVLFLSDHSRDLGMSLGVPPSRAVVIPPGIELKAYAPAEPKEDVVLFSGKLDVRKGIDDLLEVARALPQVRFRVVGWGPREAQFRSIAPPNVDFVAFLRGEPLYRAFGAARIFFFPTQGETFGIVIAEAMASGCAVVSTIPLGYEGALVPVADRAAMIKAIQRLWDDPAETTRMGRRNQELSQIYNWQRFMDALLKCYEEILCGGTGEPAVFAATAVPRAPGETRGSSV